MDPVRDRLDGALLGWDGVEKRRMFGCDAWLVNGRLFGFLRANNLMLKPTPGHREEMLSRPGVAPFIVKPGLPLGQWLQWPLESVEDAEEALTTLRAAYEAAKAQPPRATRRRRPTLNQRPPV